MPTTPPTIPTTSAIVRGGDKVAFSNAVDAFVTWLISAVGLFNSAGTACYNNAVESNTSAQNAAASASAAQAFSGAQKWVAKTYADGEAVWSPIDYGTYRKTGAGASSVDPSNASEVTRWKNMSGGFGVLSVTNTKATGTNCEVWGASPQALVINTTGTNTISGASLASNQVTLPPGTYSVTGSMPILQTGSAKNKLVLFNVTASAALVTSPNGSGETIMSIDGGFKLTSAATIDLRMYSSAPTSQAFAYAASISGVPEVYASLQITKVG